MGRTRSTHECAGPDVVVLGALDLEGLLKSGLLAGTVLVLAAVLRRRRRRLTVVLLIRGRPGIVVVIGGIAARPVVCHDVGRPVGILAEAEPRVGVGNQCRTAVGIRTGGFVQMGRSDSERTGGEEETVNGATMRWEKGKHVGGGGRCNVDGRDGIVIGPR